MINQMSDASIKKDLCLLQLDTIKNNRLALFLLSISLLLFVEATNSSMERPLCVRLGWCCNLLLFICLISLLLSFVSYECYQEFGNAKNLDHELKLLNISATHVCYLAIFSIIFKGLR
jgi:hypothetical protein